jgi:Flp pilus assembly secretin CpaC
MIDIGGSAVRAISIACLIVSAVLTTAAAAQDDQDITVQPSPSRVVPIGIGTSREIVTSRPYSTVQIVDPNIIDVVAESDRRLTILSKAAGITTLIVYDRNNARLGSTNVIVSKIPDQDTYKGVPGRVKIHNDPKSLASVSVYSCTPDSDIVKEKPSAFQAPDPNPSYDVVEQRRTDRETRSGRSSTTYERREIGR